jgi:hypothetical protein
MGRQRLLAQIGKAGAIPPLTVVATAKPGSPALATLTGGAAQRGTVGLPLPKPVQIHLQDEAGNPIMGQAVILRPRGGAVRDSVLLTDRMGNAATRWSLGPAAGEQLLRIAVEGLDSILLVTARAAPGPAAGLALTAPAGPRRAGENSPIVARVTDRAGNPVPNALVLFSGRGGVVVPGQVRSDDSGRAVARWKPDARGGEHRIAATLAGTRIRAVPLTGETQIARKRD